MNVKIWDFIQQHNMITPGDTVVAGISGGADSVCLLFELWQLQKQIPFTVMVVHVNHGIRGLEAKRDQDFVKSLCDKFGYEFTLVSADVPLISRKRHISEEEAGREVRYQAFGDKVQSLVHSGIEKTKIKIAVAHHENDQAETLLFRLARGTGLSGLRGIQPVNGNIIRPLLLLTKQEIYHILETNGLSYCEDSTNQQDDYARNRIRNQVIPYLEEHICQNAASHIASCGVLLSEAEDFITKKAQEAFERSVTTTNNGYAIEKEVFLKEDVILQKYVILEIFHRLMPGRKDIGQVHVQDVLQLFQKQVGRRIDLPYGILARVSYGKIILEFKISGEDTPEELPEEQPFLIKGLGTLEFNVVSYDNCELIPEKTYTKWFDYDKILGSLSLRTPEEGDYITFNQQLSRKLLKDYMKQEKIPLEDRNKVPVLADGNHILWVIGGRISEYYKVSKNTKQVLQVQVIGGTING